MALDLTAEQKEYGKANFQAVTEGLTRRGFMKSMAASGGAIVAASAAVYFGYESIRGKPVKAALIGGGDEGGVLVNEHNPEYLQIVAVADLRPSNMKRIFEGDPKAMQVRKGLNNVYGPGDAAKIRKYTDYKKMLDEMDKEIEAVVIATPLNTHAPIAIECMKRRKHVLCEKLMARTIADCKEMIKTAKENNVILSIGHQRHYSMLYAHAVETIKSGVLGDIKHIRALWHRNFSWPWPDDLKTREGWSAKYPQPYYRDGWFPPILDIDAESEQLQADLKAAGFKNLEELVRWRLYNRTGGGLMAELGSHQLDACSIFLGKVKPLTVTAVGGKHLFGPKKNDRTSDDHVYVIYEFPGKNHPKGPHQGTDENDIVVVTYSSICSNGFESYGECVMGTRSTMIVESEASVLLYPEKAPGKAGSPRSMQMTVTTVGAGKAAVESTSTWGPGGAAAAAPSGAAGGPSAGPISRGYREEMEDFAYCIRMWDQAMSSDRRLPRCHGEVAMADAIVALTANLAMNPKNPPKIAFEADWFDPNKPDAVPEKKYQAILDDPPLA